MCHQMTESIQMPGFNVGEWNRKWLTMAGDGVCDSHFKTASWSCFYYSVVAGFLFFFFFFIHAFWNTVFTLSLALDGRHRCVACLRCVKIDIRLKICSRRIHNFISLALLPYCFPSRKYFIEFYWIRITRVENRYRKCK